MRETSRGENVMLCFGEIGPDAAELRRTNEIIYSACTPKMASGDTQNDKDARAWYFHITILENAGDSLCSPLRLVEWVKNEILESPRTVSSPRLQPSTEGLSGNSCLRMHLFHRRGG